MASDPTLIDGSHDGAADIPDRVGPYRIVRILGRGGMGSVYLGTRDDDQFKRRVAVKVIRRGMDTEDVLKRFAVERQILTALNHPGIARVFDAGETQDGRPYVVMEYIEGLPLDVYCDKNRLNTEDRLKLFMKVCAAVHVAHQNQIVHRDLKPSNVLVTADGEPKLLDFGIAKLLNPELAAVTLVTGPELRVMTPEYASPEQAGGDLITTASDVYSLGVMLYELLTGKRPYTFKTRVRDEVLRVVQEVEPATPSTAITQAEQITTDTGETKTLSPEDLAKMRESTVDRLRRRLRGDLDNIVMMALQKTPKRRYASASEFSADIQRHLMGYPVSARPDTFGYSVSRLVRRHRGRLVLACAAAAALLVGLSVAAWQTGRVRQRDQQLQQVRAFAGEFVQSLSLSLARTEGSLPARRALVDSSTKILDYMATSFPEDEQLKRHRAAALRNLADAQGGRGQNLGQLEAAQENYMSAASILADLQSREPNDADLVAALAGTKISLAELMLTEGQSAQAMTQIEEVMALLDTAQAQAENSSRLRRERAQALLTRAEVFELKKDTVSEVRDTEESWRIRKQLLAEEPTNLEYLRDLSVVLIRLGQQAEEGDEPRLEAALDRYTEALERRKAIYAVVQNSTSKRDVATARKFVGDVLSQLGRYDEGRQQLLTSRELFTALQIANEQDVRARWDMVEIEYSLAWLESDAKNDAQTGLHLSRAIESAWKLDSSVLSRKRRVMAVEVTTRLAEWQCRNAQTNEVLPTFARTERWLNGSPENDDLIAALQEARSELACEPSR